jgi:hypothetical protein
VRSSPRASSETVGLSGTGRARPSSANSLLEICAAIASGVEQKEAGTLHRRDVDEHVLAATPRPDELVRASEK